MKPIRLLLVEDHLMMRAALRLLLQGYPNLEVIGETDSCEHALEIVARERPDVMLLDVFLAERSSLDFIIPLRCQSPHTRILMLTGATDLALHKRAMSLGAHGVVRKEEPPEGLLQAIEHVHAGHLWFSAGFEHNALPIQEEVSGAPLDSLTAREREVIQLIGQGLKNKAIAQRMGVSDKTVQNHLTSIYRKLDVHDRLELAVLTNLSQPRSPLTPSGQ